jgi:hypothetical protein
VVVNDDFIRPGIMLLFGRHECRDSCFTLFHLRCDICFAFVSVPTTKPHFTLSTTRSMSHSPTPLFHIFFFHPPLLFTPFFTLNIQTVDSDSSKTIRQEMQEEHKTKEARDERVEKHSCQIELRGSHLKLVYYNGKQVLV